MNNFISEFFGEFEPTEKDRLACELADRYHKATEEFDRTVCTGPIKDGCIMPATAHEFGLINRHAKDVLHAIQLEASKAGITRKELWRAIGKHDWR